MKRILVIAALLIASSSLALGQTLARKMTAPGKTAKTSSVEQAITQMENQRRESFLKGDAAYFERVLAEDYSGTGRNGEVTNKAQSVANVKSLSYGDTLSTPPPAQQFTTAAGRFCDRSVAALECRCNPSFI